MADVDMTDVGASGPSKSKAPVKSSKAGTVVDTGSDGKKRFEVKKVEPTLDSTYPWGWQHTNDFSGTP